ncbi:dihydrofolate reductase family protein [Cellulomonas endophytica]|uniref:dihydrofolate reductase family protein n=1 Tax=Cellulomonas endophytica TaxID=2494735 RepID=UPI001F0C9E7A|nr:dihydrofolate reductase family protein [Cellulomonas endophytica]
MSGVADEDRHGPGAHRADDGGRQDGRDGTAVEVLGLGWCGTRTEHGARLAAFHRDVLGLPLVHEETGLREFRLPEEGTGAAPLTASPPPTPPAGTGPAGRGTGTGRAAPRRPTRTDDRDREARTMSTPTTPAAAGPSRAGFTGAVFIATSLDGYIARPDGDIDWLVELSTGAGDTGYDDFIASVDALVMGRATYEKALTFPTWPYEGRTVLVLSRGSGGDADPRVRVVPGLDAAVEALAAVGARRVYVDGGRTVQSFLAAGLVQELTVTTVPVLLGSGLPLFGPLERDVLLEHRSTTVLGGGLVQSTYAVRASR